MAVLRRPCVWLLPPKGVALLPVLGTSRCRYFSTHPASSHFSRMLAPTPCPHCSRAASPVRGRHLTAHPVTASHGAFSPFLSPLWLLRQPFQLRFTPDCRGGTAPAGSGIPMWSDAMSRFIQGDCEQVMSGFPANAVDFILTAPLISSVLPTVPGGLSPMTNKGTGYCLSVKKCSGCSNPTAWP